MESIVITNSRWKHFLLLLVSLGFVGAGVFILRNANFTGEAWIGWSGIMIFGGCAVVFIWQLTDLRPRIKIDDQGIEDRTLRIGVIPWSEIADVYIKNVKGNDFVCFELRDQNNWGWEKLNVNLGRANANTKKMHEVILELRAASRKANQ